MSYRRQRLVALGTLVVALLAGVLALGGIVRPDAFLWFVLVLTATGYTVGYSFVCSRRRHPRCAVRGRSGYAPPSVSTPLGVSLCESLGRSPDERSA